jgi:acyl-CoA thioester hydrolase
MTPDLPDVSETFVRVNYSETDQMGVVYHARYLVWLDIARCEHLRRTGMAYADLERLGLRLAVGDLRIRYRQPARYDDLVRVRCWVRDCVPRRVIFGYAVDCPERSALLATAETSMLVLGVDFTWSRLPAEVTARLPASPGPLRLF